ncbi:MAG: SDR family oxidoreductase [Planctomycetota bacterium]
MIETRQRVALVTGGEQGIGRGVAELLDASGWSVHVTYRSADKGEAAAERLGSERAHRGDFLRPDDAARVVGEVVAAEDRLDAVVHAIGPYATGPLVETASSTFEEMYRGNVLTAVHLIDAARPHVRASRGAYVFFGVAGLDRWRARRVTAAYVGAKAALLNLVRAFALDEAEHGVRVNMISPGFVPHEGAAPDTLSDDLHEQIPIGGPASLAEVAGAARWLLSEEATHVVGQNLEVAGGWML